MRDSRCRSCGAKVWWAATPNGKACPFTEVKTIYQRRSPDMLEIEGSANARLERLEKRDQAPDLFVSHFETCLTAERHRK